MAYRDSALQRADNPGLHPRYIPYEFRLADGSTYAYDEPFESIMVTNLYSELYQLDDVEDTLYHLGHITGLKALDYGQGAIVLTG